MALTPKLLVALAHETNNDTHSGLSREELRDVLATVLRAGQLLLENGANTARIEETMERMAAALGVEHCDVYATPSGIITSVTAGGNHQTRIQRIVRTGVDLSRVAAVLDISRRTSRHELDHVEARSALEQVAHQPRVYGALATMLGVGLACGCTSVQFGGGASEFGITFVAAALAFLLRDRFHRFSSSRPLLTAVTAIFASALALTCSVFLGTAHPAAALSASVLFLVPGVLMVSSIADLFRGDTISGVARGVSALLTLVAVAGGLWATLLVSRAQLDLAPVLLDMLPLAILLACLSSAGFGIMFDVPQRALLAAALVGGIAYGVYRLGLIAALPTGASAFFAGATISVLAEVLARPLRMPTTIFTIPGFLPLVPGAAAFRTLLYFTAEDYTTGTASLVRTVIIVVALAAGIGTVGAIARIGRR